MGGAFSPDRIGYNPATFKGAPGAAPAAGPPGLLRRGANAVGAGGRYLGNAGLGTVGGVAGYQLGSAAGSGIDSLAQAAGIDTGGWGGHLGGYIGGGLGAGGMASGGWKRRLGTAGALAAGGGLAAGGYGAGQADIGNQIADAAGVTTPHVIEMAGHAGRGDMGAFAESYEKGMTPEALQQFVQQNGGTPTQLYGTYQKWSPFIGAYHRNDIPGMVYHGWNALDPALKQKLLYTGGGMLAGALGGGMMGGGTGALAGAALGGAAGYFGPQLMQHAQQLQQQLTPEQIQQESAQAAQPAPAAPQPQQPVQGNPANAAGNPLQIRDEAAAQGATGQAGWRPMPYGPPQPGPVQSFEDLEGQPPPAGFQAGRQAGPVGIGA